SAVKQNAAPPAPRQWKPAPGVRVIGPGEQERLLSSGNPFRVDEDIAPRFKTGAPVVTRNDHPLGHTRLPRYARAKRGVIDRDHGVFVFPDTNAARRDKKPQHCYSVRFDAQELWGPVGPTPATVVRCITRRYLVPSHGRPRCSMQRLSHITRSPAVHT